MSPILSEYDRYEVLTEHSVKRKSISGGDMSQVSNEDREMHLLDVYWRLKQVYDRVNECFFTSFSLSQCDSLTFDVEEYRRRSINLLSHLPSHAEMQGMNQIPGIWSDLFQTEIAMLSNHLLLERNIGIAERMKHYILTREHPVTYQSQKLVMSPALVKLQASVLSNENAQDLKVEKCVLHVVNQLFIFNERINTECAEDRQYYEEMREELYTIKEHELLNRLPSVGKDRTKVLPFLRRLSQMFDTDKCTLHLAMLFFDFYVHTLLSRGAIESPMDHNQALCISTACYLLACALREHWTDISSDSYLERAAEMVSGAFTSQDIVATQLDILQTMPKGFTCMYTVFEYGVFYLANIKGAYIPPNAGIGNPILLAGRISEDCSTYRSDRYTVRSPLSQEEESVKGAFRSQEDRIVESRGDVGLENGDGNHRSPMSAMAYNMCRSPTIQLEEAAKPGQNPVFDVESARALCDYLLLELGFKYLVENGGYAFIYHSLIRWDDLYVSRNWNIFIPPSRAAVVLIFHFFVEFFGVDHRKDLIWCRRFCSKVFHMLYDSDVALWYKMYRENIITWVSSLSKSSIRMGEMALLLDVSGQKFRAAETCLQTFWSRVIFGYVQQGYDIEEIDQVKLMRDFEAVYRLISNDEQCVKAV
ncbi:hypothetical protein BgAZ_107740 [Babesia gibsoni]|uniref:Cyclin N-terminal domain-containing protein n=1 Tax=Babesia gibsoni TaxID=33632 RepID=A0AAD8UW27_BABGI|nr:hypothetical protein BgAZ_107740 [Babesia gibsoni]